MGGTIYGLYYSNFRKTPTCTDNTKNQGEAGIDCGGPCSLICELKEAEFQVKETQIFSAGDKRSTLFTEVTNPAQTHPAKVHYTYEVFLPIGGRALSIEGDSYFKNGETKAIIAPGIEFGVEDISEVRLTITDVSWDTSSEDLPNVTLENIETVIPEDNPEANVEVRGFLRNTSSDEISTLRLTGVLRDSTDNIIHASVFELQSVKGFAEMPFTIFFPQASEIGVSTSSVKTDILLEAIN